MVITRLSCSGQTSLAGPTLVMASNYLRQFQRQFEELIMAGRGLPNKLGFLPSRKKKKNAGNLPDDRTPATGMAAVMAAAPTASMAAA